MDLIIAVLVGAGFGAAGMLLAVARATSNPEGRAARLLRPIVGPLTGGGPGPRER